MPTHKHTRETKRLGSLRQHWFAFEEALNAAKLAVKYQKGTSSEKNRVSRSLSFQAITAYARPFTQCDGIATPKLKGYKKLTDLRHQITAHLNALNHVYVTRVTVVNGKAINLSVVTDLLPYMPEVIAQSNKALKHTTDEILKLEKVIAKLGLADGDYE